MKFNTERFHPFIDYARLALEQAKLGVTCRFLAPDQSWDISTEAIGGKIVGIAFVFSGADAARTARDQLSKWGEIVQGFHPTHPEGTHFVVKLP